MISHARSCPTAHSYACTALLKCNSGAQAVCTAVWICAYHYYTYPLVLFFILVGSGASSYLLYGQRLRLVNMATQRRLVPVLYKNFVRPLLAKHLVPGDVIVVQRGKAVCDMVLLRGTCLVDESTLSGEVCMHTRQ